MDKLNKMLSVILKLSSIVYVVQRLFNFGAVKNLKPPFYKKGGCHTHAKIITKKGSKC